MRQLFWVLLLSVLAGGCQKQSESIWGHASTEPSSAFVELLANAHQAQVQSYENSAELIAALRTREIQFAVIEQPPLHVKDLAIVLPIFPSVLHVLVSKTLNNCEAPVALNRLLTQGTIYPGSPGSAGDVLLRQLSEVELLPKVEALDVLTDPFGAKPDIFFQFGGILPVDAVRRLEGYCLASIGFPDRLGNGTWAEGVAYRFPHLSAFVLPAGLYPGLHEQAVLTLAVTSLIVTHIDSDGELAYDVAQLATDAAGRLSELYPLARTSLGRDPTKQNYVLPIHTGAQQFLDRDAPSFVERYAELAALLLTGSIALTSAVVAAMRLRRQRRKDRIDEYLNQLVGFRKSLETGTRVDGVETEVKALQGEVTALVVGERIQADSAYVAFLSLSNQILKECRDRA